MTLVEVVYTPTLDWFDKIGCLLGLICSTLILIATIRLFYHAKLIGFKSNVYVQKIAALTMLVQFLYIFTNLTIVLNHWGLYHPSLSCRWQMILTGWLYLLSKIAFYIFLSYRVDIAFDSSTLRYPKYLLSSFRMALFIFGSLVCITIFLWVDATRHPKFGFCESMLSFKLVVPAVSIDIATSFTCLSLFGRKLWQASMIFELQESRQGTDRTLINTFRKNAVLAFVCITSTFILMFLSTFGLTGVTFPTDCVVNGVCVFLMFARSQIIYRRLCGKCEHLIDDTLLAKCACICNEEELARTTKLKMENIVCVSSTPRHGHHNMTSQGVMERSHAMPSKFTPINSLQMQRNTSNSSQTANKTKTDHKSEFKRQKTTTKSKSTHFQIPSEESSLQMANMNQIRTHFKNARTLTDSNINLVISQLYNEDSKSNDNITNNGFLTPDSKANGFLTPGNMKMEMNNFPMFGRYTQMDSAEESNSTIIAPSERHNRTITEFHDYDRMPMPRITNLRKQDSDCSVLPDEDEDYDDDMLNQERRTIVIRPSTSIVLPIIPSKITLVTTESIESNEPVYDIKIHNPMHNDANDDDDDGGCGNGDVDDDGGGGNDGMDFGRQITIVNEDESDDLDEDDIKFDGKSTEIIKEKQTYKTDSLANVNESSGSMNNVKYAASSLLATPSFIGQASPETRQNRGNTLSMLANEMMAMPEMSLNDRLSVSANVNANDEDSDSLDKGTETGL